MRTTDLVSAAVLVAFGVIMLIVVIPSYVAAGSGDGSLPPAFMPYVAAAIITLMGATLFVQRILQTSSAVDEPAPLVPGSALYIASITGIFIASFVVMKSFGYLYGAPIMVAGFMAITRTGWKAVISIAIVLPIVLWLLMEKLLKFPLP